MKRNCPRPSCLLDHCQAQLIKIEYAAVLRKDEKGKLHIKEMHDMGGGKGAVVGGVMALPPSNPRR